MLRDVTGSHVAAAPSTGLSVAAWTVPFNAMTRSQAWTRAVAWVRQSGGYVGTVGYDEERSGLSATETLHPDSVIFSIPLQCCVTNRVVKSSAVGRIAIKAASQVELSGQISASDVALAFFLAADVHCRADRSEYAPYYDLLPELGGSTEEDDPRALLPRSWTDSELEALLGGASSSIIAGAKAALAALRADYESVSGKARKAVDRQALSWPSFDQFDWACAIIGSRCFVVDTLEGEPLEVLVPLVDMFNHARPRQTTYRLVADDAARPQAEDGGGGGGGGGGGARVAHRDGEAAAAARNPAIASTSAAAAAAAVIAHRPSPSASPAIEGRLALEVRTRLPIRQGAPIHGSYGAKGNAHLLNNYGFCLAANFEPDGSSNDVRPLDLPARDHAELVPSAVYRPVLAAPLRIGPKTYAFTPLTNALDAFRHVAATAMGHGGGGGGGAKLALEENTLRAFAAALARELDGYTLGDEAARAALRGVPPPYPPGAAGPASVASPPSDVARRWRSKASAAAALVLSERATLRFYGDVVARCLLAFEDRSGGVSTLQSEVATATKPDAAAAAEDEEAAFDATPDVQLARLQRFSSGARAAAVALAYLQIRVPELMRPPPKARGGDEAKAAKKKKQKKRSRGE